MQIRAPWKRRGNATNRLKAARQGEAQLGGSGQISTEEENYKTQIPVFGQSALQLPLPGISSDGIIFHLPKWKVERGGEGCLGSVSVSNTSSCLDSWTILF